MDGKSDRDKLRNIYKVSNKEIDEIARWQRFFYSFEFGDIQKLLFSKGWTNEDEQAKSRFLEKNKDLSQLTDDELRISSLNKSIQKHNNLMGCQPYTKHRFR